MSSKGLYRTMSQQISDLIRADVLSGQLEEGTPLKERDLAERFGVSRGPVRDSLLQLTHEGLLVSKPNCGVVVGRAMHGLIQPLVIKLRQEIEIFALREILKQRQEIHLELERSCEQLKEACQKNELSAIVQYDMAFHRTIVATGGDDDLVAIWLPIVVRMQLHYTRLKTWMDSYHEHQEIVEAIRAGKLMPAIRALKANIQ